MGTDLIIPPKLGKLGRIHIEHKSLLVCFFCLFATSSHVLLYYFKVGKLMLFWCLTDEQLNSCF